MMITDMATMNRRIIPLAASMQNRLAVSKSLCRVFIKGFSSRYFSACSTALNIFWIQSFPAFFSITLTTAS